MQGRGRHARQLRVRAQRRIQQDGLARRADAADLSGGNGPRQRRRRRHEEDERGPHQAADERVYGLVAAAAAEDCSRESEDAQLRDIQEAG